MPIADAIPAQPRSFAQSLAAVIGRWWCPTLFASALLLGIVGRAVSGWTWPFWFDETFSGVIASQPTFGGLLHWCLREMTGPGYYASLWLWEKIAGPSDVALRLPSLICSLAAPLILYRRGHADRDVRALWAIFAVLWLPGLGQASEARAYALLFLLGTLQAIVFLGLMRSPTTGRATVWASISALMVVTNYFAIPICGMQGLLYLAIHRKAALRTWPAALVLIPMIAWMTVHLGFVLGYATSPSAFYTTLPLSAIGSIPGYLLGSNVHGAIVLAAVIAGLVLTWFDMRQRPSGKALMAPEGALILAGLLACGAFFALAFARPIFVARYLTPTLPALLFALAWWCKAMIANGRAILIGIVIAMFFLMALGGMKYSLLYAERDTRYSFNLEHPAYWLMPTKPKRVVFFWDSPTGEFSDTSGLAQVGGFFFRRGGLPVSVAVARVPQGGDTNAAMLALANAEPDSVMLWVITDNLDRARFPNVAHYDSRWACRDFGYEYAVIHACRRR